MASKTRRALMAAISLVACAALIFSVAGMTACSKKIRGRATSSMSEAPAEGVVPEDCSGDLDAVSYINYTLSHKSSWHADKVTTSRTTALGITADNTTTKTQKDYKNGVLVAEESVFSTVAGASSHQFMFFTEEEERCVYVREGSAPADAAAEISDITWDDETDPECWSEDYYNKKYGLFMDEISLYVLNDETLLYAYDKNGDVESNGCGDVIDNKDGTYSQTFELDTENSTYYYQYSMMTHGGISSAPKFNSVSVTYTFNSDWEILELYEEDQSTILGISSCTSTTVTTYSYDEEDLDETLYTNATEFFAPYIGALEMQMTEDEMAADENKENE